MGLHSLRSHHSSLICRAESLPTGSSSSNKKRKCLFFLATAIKRMVIYADKKKTTSNQKGPKIYNMNLSNTVCVSLTGGMGQSEAAKCSFHHPLGPLDLSLSTTHSELPTAIRICIKPNKRCFSVWGHMAAPTVGVLIRQFYICTPQSVQCNTCH